MHTCGIDIGGRATKAVILDESNRVRGRGHRLTGGRPVESADAAIEEALLAARIDRGDVDSITATGYGRRLIPGIDSHYTAVSCHAAGAYLITPDNRNVVDIGALRTAAIRLDDQGHVHRFKLNDRCRAGIGRFLERVAESLEIPLQEIGQLALFSRDPQPIPNVCSVLGETEILNHITHGDKPADILRGVCEALAERVASQIKQVWISGEGLTLSGGVAKNAGMVRALEEHLKTQVSLHHDSEYIGAIGAAVLSQSKVPQDT